MKALIFPSLKRGAFFVFSALLVSFAAGQAQSGTISGRVTGPNGTTPLEEIEVTAYRWNDHFWDSVDYRYRAGWEWVNSDGTDVNGNYSIPDLAAGRYRIEFADSYWPYGYSEEVYDNAPDLDAGRDVVVASQASTVSGVNASLCTSSHITGRVTGPDGTTPIEGVLVQAYRLSSLGDWVCYYIVDNIVDTDANGDFDIIGLSAGVYRIHFDPFNGVHASEYYSNKPDQNSANSVSVPASSTVSGVNATLDLIQPRTIHRFWSPVFAAHFYTISNVEKNNIIRDLSDYWTYEGVAYNAYAEQAAGTMPVYRFWSPVFAGHFYTMNETEANNITRDLSDYWTYEGFAWYAYPTQVAGTVPVYRFWSPVFAHHFFTVNETEKNNVIRDLSQYWTYEGVAYYAFPTAGTASFSATSHGSALASTAQGDVSIKAGMPPIEPQQTGADGDEHDGRTSTCAGTAIERDVLCDVVFPLSVSAGKVTATVYDIDAGEDNTLLFGAESPAEVAVAAVEEGRKYRLEVAVEDPVGGEARTVHASTFERRAGAPDGLGDAAAAQAEAGTGVGNPVERIETPAEHGALTLKLYSATRGVVETREGVAGGETVEFAIPEWNCWHWVGGWRESDDELVLSLWLRHEVEE